MNTISPRGLAPRRKPPAAKIPVIQTGQALMSLRDSGYSLPTALAEVVDNSIEAGARRIRVRLEETESGGKKFTHRIAVADDGEGMGLDLLHHYLVIGYSTRWMRRDTIGKYGVGAKLAALNFATRIDVWSRQDPGGEWMRVEFDLLAAAAAEKQGLDGAFDVSVPVEDAVPDELADLLPKGSGTLVVWSNVDRLEQGRVAATFHELEVEVQKELARIFREFLNGGISLDVNGTVLLPHDPLYLMEGTRADAVLSKTMPKEGDGRKTHHFAAQRIVFREEVEVKAAGGAKAYLTVTLYPEAVTRQRGKGGDALASQLGVPDNLGSISFVRLKREIAYTNVPRILPSGARPPDRFIGIEVAFDPELDEMFGVRNVKRGVEPHGELRDKIRERLKKYVPQARKLLDDRWGVEEKQAKAHAGEHGALMQAVADVNKALPKSRAAEVAADEADREREALARDTGHDASAEATKAYVERIRSLPFVVESVDFPGKMFIDVRHLDGQVIIRLNTRHRFYRELWKPLAELAENVEGTTDEATVRTASRSVEGLTLMLVAYGKAQSMDSDPEKYDDLTAYWGQFVDTLMGKVKGVV